MSYRDGRPEQPTAARHCVNDIEDLATSAVDVEPCVCLGLTLGYWDDFGVVFSENTVASADFNSIELPNINREKIPQLALRMSNVHRQKDWNVDHTVFGGL